MPDMSIEGAKHITEEEAGLKSENAQLKEEILGLKSENAQLKEENAALQNKVAALSKTSSNSSKQPSSDIVKAKKPSKPGQARKIGGQPGHEKHERPPFAPEEIHDIHEYSLTLCPECQNDLKIDLKIAPKTVQQVEILKVPIVVEEHRAYTYWCGHCQAYHSAELPDHVLKAGLFKARITALVAYMKNVCHSSFSTIRKYMRDVLGLKVSRGYLSKIIQKVSNSLEASYLELLEALPLSAKANADETGHKENGEKFWTWVFRTDLFVLFRIDKSRGSDVLIDVLGTDFNGILGCDYFSAYRKYMKDFNIIVQFCIAHLIRDIKYLCTYPCQETREYGQKLLDLVRGMFKIIHEKEQLPLDTFVDKLTRIKDQIIETAIICAPSEIDSNGKELKKPAQNMANRFAKHGQSYFEFITNPDIDPTNNVAEQAIRFIVIDRLVTQGTRSIKGRTANERIWTVIATCVLHGKSAFDFILKSVEANFYGTSSPSLLFNSS